jgi:hypothetical protein
MGSTWIYSQHLATLNAPDAIVYLPAWFEHLGPDAADAQQINPLDRYKLFMRGVSEEEFLVANTPPPRGVFSAVRRRASSERLLIGAAFALVALMMTGAV